MNSDRDLHVHVHIDNREFSAKLDKVLTLLRILVVQGEHMSIDVQGITDAVAAETSISASAITLIESISQQLVDLSEQVAQDPSVQAALNELASSLNASSASLSEAVTVNTPAVDVPPIDG